MANINSLTAKTTVELTDKFLIEEITNTPKSANVQAIINYLDGGYQQLGEVIWEDANGSVSSATYLLDTLHIYELWVGASYSVDVENGVAALQKIIIKHDNYNSSTGRIYCHFHIHDSNASPAQNFIFLGQIYFSHQLMLSMYNLDGTSYSGTYSNLFKVYKIIDMGVAQ